MISFSGDWKFCRGILACGILLCSAQPSYASNRTIPLARDVPVEREISQGEIHTYSLDVPAGHFIQVVVEQFGVDVALDLRNAEGEDLLHRDSLHGADGTDRLSTLVEADSRLTLEISTGHAEPDSHYELRLAALRPVQDTDRALVQAEELSFQAMVAAFRGDLVIKEDPDRASRHQEQAVGLWSQALPFWRRAEDDQGEAETLRWSATTLHSLGMTRYERGELLEARDCFAQAFELRRDLDPPDPLDLARTLTNLGSITSDLGEYQEALDLLEEAKATWESLEGEHKDYTATLNNLAHLYNRLGDFRTARRLYEQALTRNRQEGHPERQAETLHNLAWTVHALDEFSEAETRYREALELAKNLELPDLQATIQESRGRLFLETKRWTEADQSFREALRIRLDREDRRGEMVALHGLAKLQWRRGRLEEARDSLQQADELLDGVDHPYFQARHQMLLARVESASGAHERALEHATRALNELESLRAEVVRQDLRTTFSSVRHKFYETAVDLAMTAHMDRPKAGYDALAYTWNERARARSFLESLARAAIDPLEGVDPELAKKERALRREINSLATDESEPAQREVEEKLLYLKALRGRMARTRVGELLHTARPLDVDSVRRDVLDSGTILLEYFLGDDHSFLWVVTPHRLQSFILPAREELERAALEAHQLLATGEARAESRDWTRVAHHLSDLLLKPAARDLGKKRLVIVPDGALHYLPFAALPHPKDSTAPLLARHEVVHEVSASAVAMLRRTARDRPSAPKSLAIFADPHSDDPDLLRLPAARKEAKALAEMVPAAETWVALGEDARRDVALEGSLDQYRYVHFATHSKVDEEQPELSSISLSQSDLRLHDLYEMRLNADLVTLSACETALGRQVKGEGLISLTRGFFHAGAERVLSSLWSVDDRATMELMIKTYEGLLRRGERPAAALRRAQLELAEGTKHGSPSDWAGFLLQGEWQ